MKRPLRGSDLRPGALYYSPSGRLCMLLEPNAQGISNTSWLFSYMTRNGKTSADEGFAISVANDRAIAAMVEVDPADGCPPPLRLERWASARGLA